VILDAGFLISIDRSERTARTFLTAATRSGTALHTTHPVVAQAWRTGSRQARLSAFLKTITVHPLDDGRPVGQLLGQAGTSDVVDAHLVITALRLGHDILTGDPGDLTTLTAVLGPASPTVHPWP
jgi:predicted Zn-dependent protease